MKNSRITTIIGSTAKGIISLAFVLLITSISYQYYQKAKLNRLNNFMPHSHEYLVKIQESNGEYNAMQMKEYVYYYKLLSAYRPDRADAQGMLGYCSFHLGNVEKAITAYKKAIEIKPSFFWYHYNLGVIYYQQAQYDMAEKVLTQAISLRPEPTVEFIKSSKRIYLPILARNIRNYDGSILKHLQEGYQNSYILIESAKAKSRSAEADIKLQIF